MTVSVQDERGKEAAGFSPGVSDSLGVYKIHFSLPIRWKGIDFSGALVCSAPWQTQPPQTRFRLVFNRSQGVLAYFPKEHWLTIQGGSAVPSATPAGAPRGGVPAALSASPLRPAQQNGGYAPAAPEAKKAPSPPAEKPASPPPVDKKKAEDLFGNFSFGP